MTDKEERSERIYKYFAEINDSAIVDHWNYIMNEIEPVEVIGLANKIAILVPTRLGLKEQTPRRRLCP